MINKEKRIMQKILTFLILMAGLILPVTLAIAQEKKEEVNPNVFSAAASKLTFDGYFQLQFSESSIDIKDNPETSNVFEGVVQNTFEIRRARLALRARFTDWITGRLQVEAAARDNILRDAYLDLGFSPGFGLRFGQFKKPFSRIQLLSASVFPMIERGIRIRGIAATALDLDTALEVLRYSERDIGIMVFGNFKEAFGKGTSIDYQVALVNGAGRNVVPDTNDGKEVLGRLNVTPIKGLELAVDFANNTINGDPTLLDATNVQAFGFDAQYRPNPNNGIWLIGEVDFADNYLTATGGFLNGDDTASLLAFSVVAAYRFPITTHKWLVAFEPVFRYGFADPDRDKSDDGVNLITPGANVYFHKSVRLMFNYDIVRFQDNSQDTESAFQFRAQYIF